MYREYLGVLELVGWFDGEDTTRATFSYAGEYLNATKNAVGLSSSLPLSSKTYGYEEFSPFFSNLLPEGAVYDALVLKYRCVRSDWLSILKNIGGECIGAFVLSPEDDLAGMRHIDYDRLTEDVVRDFREFPLATAVRTIGRSRLSLAGAQAKTAMTLPEQLDPRTAQVEDWLLPIGNAPSTHIIKFAPNGGAEMAQNECVCARLANLCGLEAMEPCLLDWLPGAVAIRRYDRPWMDVSGDRRPVRLHQLDLCQVWNVAPWFKYQVDDTVNYHQIVGSLISNNSNNAFGDRYMFALRTVFNYLIGNVDFHLKNTSLLLSPDWARKDLAPAYDMLCVPLAGDYVTSLPWAYGEHRELDEVTPDDVVKTIEDLSVPVDMIQADLFELCDVISNAQPNQFDDELQEMAERIQDNASGRLTTVLKIAERELDQRT